MRSQAAQPMRPRVALGTSEFIPNRGPLTQIQFQGHIFHRQRGSPDPPARDVGTWNHEARKQIENDIDESKEDSSNLEIWCHKHCHDSAACSTHQVSGNCQDLGAGIPHAPGSSSLSSCCSLSVHANFRASFVIDH